MGCGYVIILFIVINVYHKIEGALNVTPRDTEVKINDSTSMNCSTSLQADHIQWLHGNNYVFTGIAMLEPYNNDRFSVEINASTGASNLVIRSVHSSDAGKHECLEDEGFGQRKSAQLIVLNDDPVCKSNMNSAGVIGPNSCGIEPDEIQLSCSVTYYGNILPILQWKASGDNQSITEGLFNVTSSNNEVTYTLTMRSTIGLNNSSFVCQTARTSNKHYSCSSDAINISYVFSSEVTVDMTTNDEIHCFANTSQSCSYKWKWFSGDDVTTESDNQILKPKKVGRHRCEATCSLGNRSCTVEVMYVEVYQTEVQSMHGKVYSDSITEVFSNAATFNKNLLILLLLLVVPVALVIGIAIYIWRQRMRILEMEKTHYDAELLERQQQALLVKIEKAKQKTENLERQQQALLGTG